MTILTKISEKKDKLVVPLVDDEPAFASNAPGVDIEGQSVHRRIIIFPAQARRVTPSTLLCLLIISLAGVSVGIIGGKILYNEYLSVSRSIPDAYEKAQGWVKIPMEMSDDEMDENMLKWNRDEDWKAIFGEKYLNENVEIDPANKYEKIDVPDFRNGRNGRFVHDFNTNYTGIIDVTGGRCFVMPLNRGNVLPPTSLFDLVHKMWEGYYKVDTGLVRETMRVVTPPITDKSEIGQYIATECDNMPIYKLEKYVGGVFKRSANPEAQTKFGQFAGKGILEFDIMNMDAVLEYEKGLNSIN